MDAEMKAKIAAFMDGVETEDDDDAGSGSGSGSGDDDDDGLKDLDVPDELPEKTIDYIILGCSDFEKGREAFHEMTGLKTGNIQVMRGGMGLKTCSVRIDSNIYIEIMAPEGSRTDGTPGALMKIPEGELQAFHWAVRSTPEGVNGLVTDSSWQLDKITMLGSGSPTEFKETGTYKWDLTYIYNTGLGGCVPSFVNWREKEGHPTCRLEASGAKLKKLSVRVPEGHTVLGLLESIDGVKITAGKPKLAFELETPSGKVKFEGKNTMGMVLPGYEDTSHQSYNK